MKINLIRTGEDIAQYIINKTNNVEVRYDRHGVKALIEAKNNLSQLVEDVFLSSNKPSLAMSVRKGKKHSILNMVTKDGAEVIETHEYLLPKGTNLLAKAPQVKGRTSRCILDKTEIEELIRKKSPFTSYIEKYIASAKNPTLEIASKKADKYDVAYFVLKDGDDVLTQGAYSSSIDKYCRTIKKFHFNLDDEIVSGFVGGGQRRNKVLPYLSKDKKEKYEILSAPSYHSRVTNIFKDYYGMNQEYKHLNLDELAYKYWISKDVCRQHIHKQKLMLESRSTISPDTGVDVRSIKRYKYLTPAQEIDFDRYRNGLLDPDPECRKIAQESLEYLKEKSNSRSTFKVVKSIYSKPKNEN